MLCPIGGGGVYCVPLARGGGVMRCFAILVRHTVSFFTLLKCHNMLFIKLHPDLVALTDGDMRRGVEQCSRYRTSELCCGVNGAHRKHLR